MSDEVPHSVLSALTEQPDPELLWCRTEPLDGATGAATDGVALLRGELRARSEPWPFSLVRKRFRPLTGGPHVDGANDPRHWAYWRRELLAYESGLLPTGSPLAAPRCFGVVDDAVYLEVVAGETESAPVAAHRLACWQSETDPPKNVRWLADHQLAQRIAATELDWTAVDASPEFVAIWSRRQQLLDELHAVPMVLSHGDFHLGNLVSRDGTTIVLDWGTLGTSPVGGDLAHLALSTRTVLVDDFLAGADSRFEDAAVRTGYRVTLALTATSRIHWMLSRSIRFPNGYEDFVLSQL